MTSVNEILERLHLSKRDFNNLSKSHLENIFLDLTVREVSILCRVSRKFNEICEDESFWRNKVLDNYGIEKKYGDTNHSWKEMARKMDEINMINLNDEWVNGKTYKKLLDEALEEDITYLHENRRDEFFEFTNDDEFVGDLLWFEGDEKQLQQLAVDKLGKEFTNDELDRIDHISSRAFKVITAASILHVKSAPYLPGVVFNRRMTYSMKPPDFFVKLVDPVLYVMQFSMFSDDDLGQFIIESI